MGKRHKRLKLRGSPLLLTDVRAAHWADGVLLVEVASGEARGTLALGPHMALRLTHALHSASKDTAAPFNRTRADLARSLAQEEAKP